VKTKRVEVLFEPREYQTLEERARVEGRPVGALVREAVAKYVVRPSEEARQKAAEWFLSQEMDFDSDWVKVKEEIAQARYEAIEKSMGE
jgi:uncharacterized protein YpuA (DUF1002 family)